MAVPWWQWPSRLPLGGSVVGVAVGATTVGNVVAVGLGVALGVALVLGSDVAVGEGPMIGGIVNTKA